MSYHQPSNEELIALVWALQTALERCYAWRHAPAFVEGIALTALSDSDDVISGYDLGDDDELWDTTP